jgi:hypothetical protein
VKMKCTFLEDNREEENQKEEDCEKEDTGEEKRREEKRRREEKTLMKIRHSNQPEEKIAHQ